MSTESDSIPKMMDFFTDISTKTFSNSIVKRITKFALMVLRISESVFSSDALRQGLQDHFKPKDTALFAPALHTNIMSSGTRVAVTSAKDMGQTACLITSYNHPSSSISSTASSTLVLEREEATEKDMKIWEAALATSAAPFWLLPFEKAETRTKYIDGAVYANCPAQVAYSEMEKIWPGDGASLDTLVSIGTGMQKAKSAEDVPALVNMGFFVSIRAMFQRQLDSKSSWASFRDTSAPAAVRGRLRRLDPPLGREDYVELYDWRKMDELKRTVEIWADGDAKGQIREIANTLLAGLLFFEPDGEVATGQLATITKHFLADPSRETLAGSIRCRLGHGTPELKKLLGEMVEHFAYYHLPPSANGSSSSTDALQAVARVPEAMWEKVRYTVRGRDARPSEMMYTEVVDAGTVQKFRLPYTFSVKKGSLGLHVLAVKLARCEQLVPISGFPSTHADLVRRSKMKWLQ
jgi:predicted acylesterase/phospholipase RssA